MHCPCRAVKQEAIVTHPMVKCSLSLFFSFFILFYIRSPRRPNGESYRPTCVSLCLFLDLSLSLSFIIPYRTFKFADCTHAVPYGVCNFCTVLARGSTDRSIDRSNFLCCPENRGHRTLERNDRRLSLSSLSHRCTIAKYESETRRIRRRKENEE